MRLCAKASDFHGRHPGSLRPRRADPIGSPEAPVGWARALRLRAHARALRNPIPHVPPYGDAQDGRPGGRPARCPVGPVSPHARPSERRRRSDRCRAGDPCRSTEACRMSVNSAAGHAPGAGASTAKWIGWTLVALVAWGVADSQLAAVSGWGVASARVDPTSHLGEAVAFFAYDMPKVLMLLALVVF